MTHEKRDWITDLMGDAAWTRRLAVAMLGDAASADDVVHDVWMRTREKAPTGVADRKGWIRTLLANALRTRRRADRRRLAREQASVDQSMAAPSATASPEELLGRLEVHRTLATLVAALEQPGRNVLLLHYYEGLTSAQIAAATGTPPGTVRWRLKSALDELRAKLDAHYAAEKRDWRRALTPLLPVGRVAPSGAATPVSAAGQPSATKMVLALAVLLAGAAVVLLVALLRTGRDRSPEDAPVSSTEAVERLDPTAAPSAGRRGSAGQASTPGGRPGARPVALAAASVARPCTEEIRALETDLFAARVALAYHLPPRDAWAEAKTGGQNVTAQQAIEPAVWRWLDDKRAPGAGRSIDCRHDACVVTVREAWPPTPPWVHREPAAASQAALEAHARDIRLDGPRKQIRLLGPNEAETQVWFRLHSVSGAPSRPATPRFPRSLLPSAALRNGRGPDDEVLTGECRERKRSLEDELEKLRRRSVSLVSAALLFQTETPNPALATTLQAPIDRFVRAGQALPQPERPPPLRIECRGTVCRVTAAEGVGLPEAVVGPLLKDEGFAAHVRRSSAHSINGRVRDGLYVTVLPPPSETTSGEDVLRVFLKQIRNDPAAELCKKSFPPSGSLSLRFVLPGSGEVNEDGLPERISFRLGGPVAGSRFGQCLAEALARSTAAFVPPSGISGAEMSKTVELPE